MARTAVLKTLLPHSSEAERTVIAALLIDSDKLADVATLITPDDFYDPVYKEIYAAIVELDGDGDQIDFVSVTDKLQDRKRIQDIGGSAFVAEVAAELPTASHAGMYAKIVKERSIQRALIAAGKQITSIGEDNKLSATDAIEQAEQKLLAISMNSITDDDTVQVGDELEALYDRQAELIDASPKKRKEMLGIRTGFFDLDQKLLGLQPEDMTVIAARPGMGKTALAVDIAMNATTKQKKTVSLVSLEMNRKQLIIRIAARVTGLAALKMSKGELKREDLTKIRDAREELRGCPLHLIDNMDTSLAYIRSKARRQKMQHGLDLLVIDYLQLIQCSEFTGDRVQQVSHISREIKRMARELKCPIIAVSQLSRKPEDRLDKRPQLADLRESGSIEQDADNVLMLYDPAYYDEDCDDPAELYIRKQRQGPTGKVNLHLDKDKMSFTSVTKQYDGDATPDL